MASVASSGRCGRSWTGAVLGWVLESLWRHSWTTSQSVIWLSGLLLTGLALHAAWGHSLAREGDRGDYWAAFVRIALLSGLAALLGMSASARLAQLTGALTCGVGVVEVGSRVLGRKPWHGGAALVLTTATAGLLAAGYFYAEVATWPGLLTLAACLSLGLPLGGGSRSRLLTLVPLALALALAGWTFLNEPDDPYADYYDDARLSWPASR